MAKQYQAISHPFAIKPELISANALLREPQSQGYAALRDFWKNSNKPALVQIPVGCGKTGLMTILPFGNCAKRALYVAPNLTIRSSIAAAVDPTSSDCFWKRMGLTRSSNSGPFCAILDGPDAQFDDCQGSHFIVSNIQQIVASGDRWLNRFEPDFFDMILIDEGHHNPAASWRKLFDRFPHARVVSLTATPFRSDGQDVIGELVYRYTFTRGMAQGYIKRLLPLRVTPSQIYFTYRDDTKLHTLEEVLRLREEAWFRRGVALAPKCNWDIVRASVQKLLQLRDATGTHHQIIATTCSIDHAAQVRALYEKVGVKARQLHSVMSRLEREKVLAELRQGRIDCIVQVEMLGEGFDHPPLSVGAIFRPFASLAPYVQFVGRIMRVLREREPEHLDNQGWVVSHAGLHVDRHWNDFCQLDDADQQFFRSLVRVSQAEQQSLFAGVQGAPPMAKPRKKCTSKKQPGFVPPPVAKSERTLVAPRPIPFQASDRSARKAKVAIRKAATKKPTPLNAIVMAPALAVAQAVTAFGPQQKRRSLQIALRLACRGAVAELLAGLKLSPKAWNLFRRVRGVGPGSNFVTLTMLVHQRLNHRLGLAPGEKSKIDLEMTEHALLILDEVVSQLAKELRIDPEEEQ